jgi:hypothetical protein
MAGYLVDAYPDGTASVDIGHDHCCITSGYIEIEPVRREDLTFNDYGLTDAPDATEPKRRRGRPRKADTVLRAPKPQTTEPYTGEKKPKPRAPEPVVQTNILTITSLSGDRATLTYRNGDTSIELEKVSVDDLVRICSVIESLSNKGVQS